MKTRVIITMLALIGIFQFAGAQTIRDNSNVTIGKIERDGTVRNAGNTLLSKENILDMI